MLRTETNTTEMYQAVLKAAKKTLRKRNLTADFEHGQWWVTELGTGAQWAVNDAETQTGEQYFDFEQVSEGDEDS